MTTKWWKCDLQVATPAWNFTMPAGEHHDLSTIAGKRAFAERYVSELINKGIEVVVLADHNTGEWIDLMVEAGKARGVTVFPGCEITTGSGADGMHLVVIGDSRKTSRDFDVLLGGTLGFREPDHPRFLPRGEPGSSSRTITQILDDLPDDYLVIAPHVLTDNGIASGKTAHGDIRWRALHHPRLVAVDPGDCDGNTGGSFNSRFRNRDPHLFRCLPELAFVATSDAYSLDRLGARFSWIRMEEPTLEGLRQAFLDHEARIICSWDERLRGYPNENPNNIRHSWISSLSIGGAVGNSSAPLSINFHPALNVIIGGRGSGKSTVVAAIRQLYSSTQTLPENVRVEAESFSDAVFSDAQLLAEHRIRNSQEQQRATWSAQTGQSTETSDGGSIPTTFSVRVVNQKELFERVSRDRHDPLAASRSFLAFLDEGLGLLKTDVPKPESWWRRFQDAGQDWMMRTTDLQRIERDVAQLPAVRAKIRELEAQVAALDSPEAKNRREANDARIQEKALLDARTHALGHFLAGLMAYLEPEAARQDPPQGFSEEHARLISSLDRIETSLVQQVRAAIAQAQADMNEWREATRSTAWAASVKEAEEDNARYMAELAEKGIDPGAYNELKKQLAAQLTIEQTLSSHEAKLISARSDRDAAWQVLEGRLDERRDSRRALLQSVSERSGRLRFNLLPFGDSIGWVSAVRELLGLRSDGFLEDVPRLANWLWTDNDKERSERWSEWRAALTSGNFERISGKDAGINRAEWAKKLEKLDATIRLRLAFEAADDKIEISFLKDGGDSSKPDDWQDITQGSPGQRTAAMLGFVLHHGDEPLVLDQPEDDLDTEWISNLVVTELRASRWKRQLIVVTHNANIPVNGDAERVVVLENRNGAIQIRSSGSSTGAEIQHCGAIEQPHVRADIQNIMEGGIRAFMQRERKYGSELATG